MIFLPTLLSLQITPNNKMLSEAGRSYARSKAINPFTTRQRFYSYNLPKVHSPNKSPQHHQSLSTNLRSSRDSYILRHTKQTVTNTDHYPNYQTISTTHPRPYFAQSALKRYIGDVRQDYERKELSPGCDHRCAHANGVARKSEAESSSAEKTERIDTHAESNGISHKRKGSNAVELEYSPSHPTSLPVSIPVSNRRTIGVSDSLDLSKNFSLKSTEPSVLKKRSKQLLKNDSPVQIIQPEKENKAKGVRFESSVGHQYGEELGRRSQNPQTYTLDIKKQAFIRRSIPNPKNYVKFDQFRHKVMTRYDRVDPNWHLSIDSHDPQIPPKDKSYHFDNYSSRKMNQVQSKYSMRQCMNLPTLPIIDSNK